MYSVPLALDLAVNTKTESREQHEKNPRTYKSKPSFLIAWFVLATFKHVFLIKNVNV